MTDYSSGGAASAAFGTESRLFQRLAVPIILLVVCVTVFVTAVLISATGGVDKRIVAHSLAIARLALDNQKKQLSRLAADYSIWNDAVIQLTVAVPDSNWIRDNAGPNVESFWGIDHSYAFDGGNRLIYASAYGLLRDDSKQAREELADRSNILEQARRLGQPIAGLVVLGGQVTLFAASVIDFQTGYDGPAQSHPLPVQIFTKTLTAEAIAQIAEDYRLTGLTLVPGAERPKAQDQAALALAGIDGKVLGYLTWSPDLSGQRILFDILPLGVFFLVLVAALIWLLVKALGDIEAQREALRESEARRADAQRIAGLGHWVRDPRKEGIECSAELAHVMGLAPVVTSLSEEQYFALVALEDRAQLQEVYNGAAREQRGFQIEYRIIRPDGEVRIVSERGECRANPLTGLVTVMGTVQDITERKRAEDIIFRQANYDGLTGLPNRHLFLDRLNVAVRQAQRDGSSNALMFIDLDRFKWVNDTLGHAAGDDLLREAARRLRSCVRESDTVARLGGDEFTLILTGLANRDDSEMLARNILKRMQSVFHIGGREVFISASIGITSFPQDSSDAQVLLRNADTAMYKAKEGGRNAWRIFMPHMNEEAVGRLELESDLRRALDGDQFELFFQPVIDLRSNRVAGAEALIRWHHPGRGLLGPGHFIPLAEETGLILPLGEWVIETGIRQLAHWRRLDLPPLRLAMNVSSRQFLVPGLVDRLKAILRKEDIPPERIDLEVTESLLLDPSSEIVKQFKSLRGLGVNIALDDFGTGYSSLSYLKQFPINKLKIDKAFIRNMAVNEDDAVLVGTIIDMAGSLRMQVVAEGVESEQQNRLLRERGCDFVQGYFHAKPLTAAEFVRFVVERNAQMDEIEADAWA